MVRPNNYCGIVTLTVKVNNEVIKIRRNENWEINISQTAPLFNKDWRNFVQVENNFIIINNFEILAGKNLIREVNPRFGPRMVFLDVVLALYVLSRYSKKISYQVHKLAEKAIVGSDCFLVNITKSGGRKYNMLWSKWIYRNSETLKIFELLENSPIVRKKKVGPGNLHHISLSYFLFLRFYSNYSESKTFTYNIFETAAKSLKER